jgi:hypothetical protein
MTVHPVSATGLFGTAAFTFTANVTMDYTGHPAKDSLIIDLDNKNDTEAFNTFLKTYLNSISVEESKVEYVDATFSTITSGQTSATKLGFIWYGGLSVPDNKKKVLIGQGILSGDTGNASYQGKGIGNYPVQITTLAASTSLTIPNTLFNASLVTQATAITIATAERGTILFLAP